MPLPLLIAIPEYWADPGSLAQAVLTFVARRRRPVWLVGGAVRDRLRQRSTHDLDLAVEADAAELARAVADHFGGAFHHLDARRDIGRALLPASADAEPLIVDVARLQDERSCPGAALRQPSSFVLRSSSSLEADLKSRDFTINALAVRLNDDGSGDLVDVVGGLDDLRQGMLRVTAPGALEADPIRLLRAPRLAGEMGLRLAPETIRSIRTNATLLADTSAERVRDEMWRMLAAPECARLTRVLHHLGLLTIVLPEMGGLVGLGQSSPHRSDVFEHTLQAMQATDRLLALVMGQGRPRDVPESLLWEQWSRYFAPLRSHFGQPLSAGRTRAGWLRWLALAHDWGKGITRTVEPEGRVRFLGHDGEGARLVTARLETLRFSRDEIRHLSELVRHHMRPFALTLGGQAPSRRAVYRFFRDAGDGGPDLLLFSLADHRATYGPDLDLEGWRDQVERTATLLGDWFERRTERVTPSPLLDGHDLIANLGIPPGPQVGRLLAAVCEAQAAGEVNDLAQALDLARQLLSSDHATVDC